MVGSFCISLDLEYRYAALYRGDASLVERQDQSAL
jgi:hypothetical protein